MTSISQQYRPPKHPSGHNLWTKCNVSSLALTLTINTQVTQLTISISAFKSLLLHLRCSPCLFTALCRKSTMAHQHTISCCNVFRVKNAEYGLNSRVALGSAQRQSRNSQRPGSLVSSWRVKTSLHSLALAYKSNGPTEH